MEDAQNIDIVIRLDQVGYPVMTVIENSNFALAGRLVFVPDPGMGLEQLGLSKDA